MKKIFFTILAGTVLFAQTGCLKDDDLDKQKYGLSIPDTKGVSFPLSLSSPYILGIVAQSTPVELSGPPVVLEQRGTAATDVHIVVNENNALLASDPTLVPLPTERYTITGLNVTVPAGSGFSDNMRITITNSDLLDPNTVYAIGLTITSADNGYTVARNQRDVVVVFTIKNRYDAVYSLRMRTTGWAAYTIADGVGGPYPGEFEMSTINPTTVDYYSTYREDYLVSGFNGGLGVLGSPTAFGAATPLFIFDDATNKLVEVRNSTPDDGRGRRFEMNPAVTDSRFDPATRTIYASFMLLQNGRPNMIYYDTLSFVRERE